MAIGICKRTATSHYVSDPASELFAQRCVWLAGAIDDVSAQGAILGLSYLDGVSSDPIHLLVNSPGGSVTAGLAVIDCMRGLRSPVHTHAYGLAASMGAVILACGEPGGRSVSPNATVMIHQPAAGFGGQALDLEIAAKNVLRAKGRLEAILAQATGRTPEEIAQATERNNWMDAREAVAFGIADAVEDGWLAFRG